MIDGYNPNTLTEDATTAVQEMQLRRDVLRSQSARHEREADETQAKANELRRKADAASRLADDYHFMIGRLT